MSEQAIQDEPEVSLEETPDVPETPDAPEPAPEPPSPASKDDVASIVSEAFSRLPQPAQPEKPPMTQEEREKLLRVAKFDDKFAEQLRNALTAEEFNPKTVVDLFHQMRDSFQQQFYTYSDLLTQKLQHELNQQYAPMQQAYQQQQQEAIKTRFFGSFPDLKPFERIIPVAAKQVMDSGQRFANEADEFKAVAKAVEQLIQSTPVGKQFKLSQGKGGEPKPARALNGGQVGAGDVKTVRTAGADPALL